MADEIIVLITAGAGEEAAKIARSLVEERLVACVNIVPEVRSIFFWDNSARDERETLLVCKSRAQRLDQIIARVKELHTYAVPEIIALPIIGGSRSYLDWLKEATTE